MFSQTRDACDRFAIVVNRLANDRAFTLNDRFGFHGSRITHDNSEAPKTKNVSEVEFEKYLASQDLNDWDYEPEISGKNQRPDYRLRYAATDLFLEVKEFRQGPKQQPPQGGAYDPYTAIREKIDSAREKFKNFKEQCCSLVLFNVDAWLVHLDDFWIIAGAMLGDLGFSFPVDMETGSAVGEPTWAFLKRGKMIDYKHLRPQNTTISALIALTPLASETVPPRGSHYEYCQGCDCDRRPSAAWEWRARSGTGRSSGRRSYKIARYTPCGFPQ